MCGRYVTTDAVSKTNHLAENSSNIGDYKNYNAYPTCMLPILLHENKKLIIKNLIWGLVPKWADGKNDFKPLNNARVESVDEKPTFRSIVKKYRCVVIADGYYEWQTTDNGKQPFYIHRNDGGPLYFGGLHQRNKDHEFVILTQESEGAIKPIHHRMPLMLNENQFDQFFDYEKSVSSLSREQSVELSYHPVSRKVNSPKNNGIELINKV